MKQDYGAKPHITGVEIKDLKVHWMDDGRFVEVGRFSDKKRIQVNHSIMLPGATKAFHFHQKQTDEFYSFQPVLVVLYDSREDSPTKGTTMRFVMCNQRVTVPPNILHGLKAIDSEPTHLFYVCDEFFDGSDEGRLPYTFMGKEVWNMTLG